jgi:hypothetical protein
MAAAKAAERAEVQRAAEHAEKMAELRAIRQSLEEKNSRSSWSDIHLVSCALRGGPVGDNAAFEYGKKMEQAGPQVRRVAARYGLEIGDGTVLNSALGRPGDSEESKARLEGAGLVVEDANGRKRISEKGHAVLNLMSQARFDQMKAAVDELQQRRR